MVLTVLCTVTLQPFWRSGVDNGWIDVHEEHDVLCRKKMTPHCDGFTSWNTTISKCCNVTIIHYYISIPNTDLEISRADIKFIFFTFSPPRRPCGAT